MKDGDREALIKEMETNFKSLAKKVASEQDAIKKTVQDDMKRLGSLIGDLDNKVDDVKTNSEPNLTFTPFTNNRENPESWLRTFESECEFKGYDIGRKLKAFKMLMRGSAATWYDDIEKQFDATSTDEEKWKDIKAKMIERFGVSNTWLAEHLIQFTNQREGDSVQRFYSTVVDKCVNLKKPREEMMAIFIRGLKPSIKLYVLAREPKDIEAAYQQAKAAEDLETISDLTSNQMPSSTQPVMFPGEIQPKAHYESLELKEIRESIKELENKLRTSSRQIPKAPMMTCYYCNKLGHRAMECRQRLIDLQYQRNGRPQNRVFRQNKQFMGPPPAGRPFNPRFSGPGSYSPRNNAPRYHGGSNVNNRPRGPLN